MDRLVLGFIRLLGLLSAGAPYYLRRALGHSDAQFVVEAVGVLLSLLLDVRVAFAQRSAVEYLDVQRARQSERWI